MWAGRLAVVSFAAWTGACAGEPTKPAEPCIPGGTIAMEGPTDTGRRPVADSSLVRIIIRRPADTAADPDCEPVPPLANPPTDRDDTAETTGTDRPVADSTVRLP